MVKLGNLFPNLPVILDDWAVLTTVIFSICENCVVKVNKKNKNIINMIWTELWAHHICANIVWERLDCMKISMTSVPVTRPSLSVSIFLKMSSYLSLSATGTTQFTAGWNKRRGTFIMWLEMKEKTSATTSFCVLLML